MDGSKLILVEGPDDAYVVRAILDEYRIPCEIQERFRKNAVLNDDTIIVQHIGGITELGKNLYGILGSATLKYLGIIVDTDVSLVKRWQAITGALKASGAIQMPMTPDTTGTVIETVQPEGSITVGIWLMPDNQNPGALEQFIELLIPPLDAPWIRAQRVVDEIPNEERLFKAKHLKKVYLHTWLAWQKDPGSTIGQVITNNHLAADAPNAQTFVAWVRRVFDL